MSIIKKSLIVLVFLIIFSSLVIAQNSECEDYTYSNCPEDCDKACISSSCEGDACTADCDGPGSCFKSKKEYTQLDNCAKKCKEVTCKNEGEECRRKCIHGCKADYGEPKKGDDLTCLQCGDSCVPSEFLDVAMCTKPTKELICGVENDKCIIIEEDSFFEDIENDLTKEELVDINNDLGSGGIGPDSPLYFLDEAFAKVFGENREEKIAEVITMIEKEDYDSARIAMKKYKDNVNMHVKKASPENKEAAKKEAVHIHRVLKKVENKIPIEYKEEFIDQVIESEKGLVTAVEIASKIEELCKSLANLDPVKYSNVCKTNDESPKWQKKLDKDLTKDQKREAQKFGKIMAECFESSGENCKCDEIPYPQFAEACTRVAPLAQACELKNDEKACKKLDNFNMPRLPDHLEKVMIDLDKKVMKSKFELHMPIECTEKGITSHEECKKIMIQTNSPPECKEALANVEDEREGRKICDKIMMDKYSPKCAEKVITSPEECAMFMDSFREDDKFIDNKQGPRIDFNCKNIEDPTKRLECFDKASSQAKGYKGHNDEDYEGPCMTERDWKNKKQECRKLFGEHAGDKPIMGDSGEGYECVIDAKCIDFGYKDTYVAPNECKNVGALSREACKKHISDVRKLGPGCDDCESKCPGASRTNCVNDACKCYYEDKEPEKEVNECKDGCDDECPGASRTSGCENNGNRCICHYENEVSECANNACSEKCGDRGSDCRDEKCVCFDYEDSSSETDTRTADTEENGQTLSSSDSSLDSDDSSSNSDSDDSSGSDDSSQSDNDASNNENSANGGLITGNVFLDYWYN